MEKISMERLIQERKDWKKDKMFGFFARPAKNQDGTQDMYKWECGIPGPVDSPWEGGIYDLLLEFPEDYPSSPPKAKFKDKLFHPNVYPSGTVCLSILSEEEDWRPKLKVKDVRVFLYFYQLLLGIQNLLKHPNEKSPAQQDAYLSFINDRKSYENKVRQYAKENSVTRKF